LCEAVLRQSTRSMPGTAEEPAMRSEAYKALMTGCTAAACVAGLALVACVKSGDSAVLTTDDHASAPVVSGEGKQYKIVKGAAYEVKGRELHYREQLYDPDFYAKNYRVEQGTIYRYVDDAHKYAVRKSLKEGFESASTIRDLIGPVQGWNSVTLQGPRTPTVNSYVELRRRILAGQSDFLDNRIEPSSALVRTGKRALRAYALAAGPNLPVSKASLECELLHFRKGDHFWFRAWYNIVQGSPTGIFDLESSFIQEYPGMRILLSETLVPRVELKWATKPTYVTSAPVTLARNRWTEIRLHIYLSDQTDGQIQLWVDGRQVINAFGQTLPLADTVYDRIEVGIPANAVPAVAEVYVDDVEVDSKPFL
jgi:hypothetical protein